MTKVAYARTSTVDQSGSLETQIARFKALGVDPDLIFAEQRSGSNADRPKLKECLRTLRKGDTPWSSPRSIASRAPWRTCWPS